MKTIVADPLVKGMDPDPEADPRIHLHHFSKIKSHKDVTKQKESMFFLLICSMIGAGSVSLTNRSGCGLGRPKNIWILRIRIRNTDENTGKY
jgi:hypothetical protein